MVRASDGTERLPSMEGRNGRRGGLRAILLLFVASVAGCELEEVSVVEVEDVVVAEVYANVAQDPAANEIFAFLHQTVGQGDPVDDEVELLGARVTVRRDDGTVIPLQPEQVAECMEDEPTGLPVACFVADSTAASVVGPGDLLSVEIELFDGGRLEGATVIPGAFELVDVAPACTLPPDELLPLQWTRSEGAWAYVNETAIARLPEALRPEGIEVEEDPLYLLGLSISDADTTTVFPAEFGVFNRFDLDQDLAVRLQSGLPAGTSAEVTITATDRNYVNWARGGNFNPSGQVRVPSLRGDGTGVFGSTVNRRILVAVPDEPVEGTPSCLADPG